MPVESILSGTWGGDAGPDEWTDFRVMREMGWTFEQLQATPTYVRGFVADFIGLMAAAQEAESKPSRRDVWEG